MSIAHHHPLIREALAQSLARRGEFTVASHGDVDEVLTWVRGGRRSVVLASRNLPGVGQLLSTLKGGEASSGGPGVPVALLGEAGAARPAAAGLPPGASGYLPEDADTSALSHAVHTLASGAAVLPASWIRHTGAAAIRAETREPGVPLPLSLREREVLVLLGRGLTNQQIGKRLGLGAGTVKSYISAVYTKCGVDNRVQAALFAHGIEVLAA
ncbi:LuxR C-terminal-related transcriptional regulator [Streptomyces sp. NPDC059828]|uniref:response regulator transcription factor n=1 Tax=Streptomyces sp. NPDC059828 TaxID=3346965 RepID=UPI003667A4B4